MRVLVLTPKIIDESLSATTRTGVLAVLAKRASVRLAARFRDPAAAAGLPWPVVPIRAPRVPGISMAWFQLAAPFAAARQLRDFRPDVVMVEPAAVLAAALATRLARTPDGRPPVHLDVRTLPIRTHGIRSRLDGVLTAGMLRLAGRTCASFSAITPGAADWLSAAARVPVDRIAVWGTGVDPARFDPTAHAGLDPADRPVRLLYHGAVYASRGLDELIDSMALLRESAACAATLTIMGTGPDVAALAERVERLGLAETVLLRGAVPAAEVPRIIAEHHAGVIPLPDLDCWRTSSPTKLLEYLAMCRPVVLTDIEAHRLVVGDAPVAAWAGTGGAAELAEAIAEACRRLTDLSAATVAFRPRLLASHSWDAQGAILTAALEAAREQATRAH